MGLDIATGGLSDSPDGLLPLNDAGLPGVAPETYVQPGQLSGPTYPARDTTGEYAAPLAAMEADIRAAQSSGMDARNAMLGHYQAQALPVGGHIGDAMTLPPVPANAVPSEQSDLYPYSGMEPTPAGVGFYHGNEPTLPE